jgi:hypothetical protein
MPSNTLSNAGRDTSTAPIGTRPPESAFAAEHLSRGEVALIRDVDALALHRLDDERRDVAARKLALELLEIAEGDRVAVGQQRAEAFAELLVAVDRQRAEREPVERMVDVQHARAPGRGTGDLDRRLDRLGARVRRHHRTDARGRSREQLLGEHPAQQRDAQLREVSGAGRHHLLDGRDRLRMVAADREHAVAAE